MLPFPIAFANTTCRAHACFLHKSTHRQLIIFCLRIHVTSLAISTTNQLFLVGFRPRVSKVMLANHLSEQRSNYSPSAVERQRRRSSASWADYWTVYLCTTL